MSRRAGERRRAARPAHLHRASFVLEPWRKEVVVLHGGTQTQVAAYVHDALGAHYAPNANTLGHAFLYDGKPYVLWVHQISDTRILVHECLHVTFAVLRSRGVRPGAATEETYAYTLDNLFDQVVACREWTVIP